MSEEYNRAREWYRKGVEGIFREGEEYIAMYGNWAYFYARDKLKGRFMVGEEVITKNALFCHMYAKFLKEKGIEI